MNASRAVKRKKFQFWEWQFLYENYIHRVEGIKVELN